MFDILQTTEITDVPQMKVLKWNVIAIFLSQFFNQVLMLGKTSVSDLSEHVFDLILELYNIDSHLLLSVLPQLEFKLKVSGSYLFCKIMFPLSYFLHPFYDDG